MTDERWHVVGRDRVYAAVVEELDAEPGRSVVVAGPAGVGRTRLARDALRHARNRQRTTRWAVGTASAAAVPLGALAHLLPAVGASSDPLALLQRAAQAIAGEAGERPLVLGVDDVHLLDPLSMNLLHHLAVSGAATLVLTVRTDPLAPDPTTPLWKDGLASRLDLQPLSRADLDRLAGEFLDGDVETRTSEALWRLSQGIPLYFRELVEDGLRTGRLRASGALWRWQGTVTPSERLTTIVLAQLGGLDAVEWAALEVVAADEAVSVGRAVELTGQDVLAALERRGLVVVEGFGPSALVRMAQPLYAEVVRSRASEAALQLVRRRLTDGAVDDASPDELLRRCAPTPGRGLTAPSAAELVTAARRAITVLDHPLAEQLARAAVEAGGGAEAYLALMEAAFWQGEAAAAEGWAAEAATSAVSDDTRARLAARRALTLFCRLGRPQEARTVLDRAADAAGTEEACAILVAAGAVLSFLSGEPARAVAEASGLLRTAAGSGVAGPLAAAAAAAGSAVTGDTERALAGAHAGLEALGAQPDAVEMPFARILLAQAEVMALYLGGRYDELDLRARELYRRNLAGPEWAGDAVACLHRGCAGLAGGRPRSAIRWLNEALVGFDLRDPTGMRPVCVAFLTMARALAGDTAGARHLLGDLEKGPSPASTVFGPHLLLARAWVAAAEGRTADAGGLAMDAAVLAARQGQWAAEAAMLHSALTLGRAPEVVERLRDLAALLGSPLAVHSAALADAAVAGAADRLEAVSRAFEEGSALLPAAHAAARAAAAHERAGDRRAAAAATARAKALAREGGLLGTPALDVVSPPDLTAREGEVARLAARGLSNLEIADRLVLSVRTVEAHLAHVYSKLGIGGRPELQDALDSTHWRRPSRSAEGDVGGRLRPRMQVRAG